MMFSHNMHSDETYNFLFVKSMYKKPMQAIHITPIFRSFYHRINLHLCSLSFISRFDFYVGLGEMFENRIEMK